MEMVENQTNKKSNQNQQKFLDSEIVLKNKSKLYISGVEKVFEAHQTKIQLQVSGSVLMITGQNLNITRLDVESGNVDIDGSVEELKFSNSQQKTNFLKKMFK